MPNVSSDGLSFSALAWPFKLVRGKHTEKIRLYILETSTWSITGRGSVFGIATSYGLDGPRIESRWERDFPHLSRPTLGPTQPPVQWVPGLSRG
jgi:hypothetical protein